MAATCIRSVTAYIEIDYKGGGVIYEPFSCARSSSRFIYKHSKDALVTTLLWRADLAGIRASRID